MHPEFALWNDLLDAGPVDQRQLMQHVRAAEPTLGEDQTERWLTTLGLVRVVSGGHVESHVDRLGYTKLRGGEQSNEVSTTIPPTLNVQCPLFEGIVGADGAPHHYDLEMLVEFDAPTLGFAITCPMLPLVRAQAVEDVARMLARDLEELGKGFLVLRGEFVQETVPVTPVAAPTSDETE